MEDDILIEVIKNEQLLYDVSAVNYRNNDKKERCWEKIAKEVNAPGRIIMIAIGVLAAAFTFTNYSL